MLLLDNSRELAPKPYVMSRYATLLLIENTKLLCNTTQGMCYGELKIIICFDSKPQNIDKVKLPQIIIWSCGRVADIARREGAKCFTMCFIRHETTIINPQPEGYGSCFVCHSFTHSLILNCVHFYATTKAQTRSPRKIFRFDSWILLKRWHSRVMAGSQ